MIRLDLGSAMARRSHLVPASAGRVAPIHLKEYSSSCARLIGEGEVDWQEVFRLCEEQGVTEWYIVEQENYALPPIECVARCLDNLRAMGK